MTASSFLRKDETNCQSQINSMVDIERQLAVIQVNATAGATRQQILSLLEIFHGRVLSISVAVLIVEVTGNCAKVDALLELLDRFEVRAVARTAPLVISHTLNEHHQSHPSSLADTCQSSL